MRLYDKSLCLSDLEDLEVEGDKESDNSGIYQKECEEKDLKLFMTELHTFKGLALIFYFFKQ